MSARRGGKKARRSKSSTISPFSSTVTRATLASLSDHRPSSVETSQTVPTRRELRWAMVMRWPTDHSSSSILRGQLITPCVPFKATRRPITRVASTSRRSNRSALPPNSVRSRVPRQPPSANARLARHPLCRPFRERREKIGCRCETNACLTDRWRKGTRPGKNELALGPVKIPFAHRCVLKRLEREDEGKLRERIAVRGRLARLTRMRGSPVRRRLAGQTASYAIEVAPR